jgi:hypothetical protein
MAMRRPYRRSVSRRRSLLTFVKTTTAGRTSIRPAAVYSKRRSLLLRSTQPCGHGFHHGSIGIIVFEGPNVGSRPTGGTFYTYDDPTTAFLKMLYVDLKIPGGPQGSAIKHAGAGVAVTLAKA